MKQQPECHQNLPLDELKIATQLKLLQFSSHYKLHLFPSINSTNTYLKNLNISSGIDVCCSESQTQGRGRFGRQWHSPFGENIYFSGRWVMQCELSKLSGLGLITSLAVLATLKEIVPNLDIKIKWPNDILWGNKKLCGSLIEVIANKSHFQVIIGIGINVNTDTINEKLLDKAWCSLFEISNQYHDRNLIIARLIYNLERYIQNFLNHNLNYFSDEWQESDYLLGKYIRLTQGSEHFSGIARGINSLGQLKLETKDLETHYFSAGDTSLHSMLDPKLF